MTTLPFDQTPRNEQGEVDFKEDFFGRATNLTVSGQLEGELAAMGFSEIYTFGPTFRAENSNTARHLAEFWMIEPEMAFYDLEDNMNLAEAFIRYLIGYVMENNRADLEFLAQRLAEEEKQKPQAERSETGADRKAGVCLPARISNGSLIQRPSRSCLQSPAYKKKKFQYEVAWGIDLQSEHERYLVEKHFKKPVIVSIIPKRSRHSICVRMRTEKPWRPWIFWPPASGKWSAVRKGRRGWRNWKNRMREMHIPVEQMWWYLDTRRFGTVPHAGFGLGFERMMLFVTGMTNIRDVIPFPRTPKNAEF